MTARVLVGAATLLVLGVGGGQSTTVRISGRTSLTLSAGDLASMPRAKVTATSHDQAATYEGVLLGVLLTRVGVAAGEALRGSDLAQAVVVTGADGYQVAFGIAEFDSAFTDRVAILADRKDGAPLAGNEAPYQLILTGEKRPARWVRQVVSIEVQPVKASK
jgi:hypothetical protein